MLSVQEIINEAIRNINGGIVLLHERHILNQEEYSTAIASKQNFERSSEWSRVIKSLDEKMSVLKIKLEQLKSKDDYINDKQFGNTTLKKKKLLVPYQEVKQNILETNAMLRGAVDYFDVKFGKANINNQACEEKGEQLSSIVKSYTDLINKNIALLQSTYQIVKNKLRVPNFEAVSISTGELDAHAGVVNEVESLRQQPSTSKWKQHLSSFTSLFNACLHIGEAARRRESASEEELLVVNNSLKSSTGRSGYGAISAPGSSLPINNDNKMPPRKTH